MGKTKSSKLSKKEQFNNKFVENKGKETEMEKALMAIQILGGLGSFFTGIGVFWLGSILNQKKQ